MSEVRTLVIDGKDVAASSDQSVLSAAQESGIHIPTLCHLDGLSDVGACRLCVVEVEGSPKLFPHARPRSKKVCGSRRPQSAWLLTGATSVELFFLERNHICAVCVANNHCELQSQARALSLTHFELPALHPEISVDATDERFAARPEPSASFAHAAYGYAMTIEGTHTWDVLGAEWGRAW